jgi:hypothetical protein
VGDYLKSVAARVSEKESALRPRLPSLFEPPKGLASARVSAIVPARADEREESAQGSGGVSTAATPPSHLPAQVIRRKHLAAAPAFTSELPEAADQQPLRAVPLRGSKPEVPVRQSTETLVGEEKIFHDGSEGAGTPLLRTLASKARLKCSEQISSLSAVPVQTKVVEQSSASLTAKKHSLSLAPSGRRAEVLKETHQSPETRAAHSSTVPPISTRTTANIITPTPTGNPVLAVKKAPEFLRADAVDDPAPHVQVVIGRLMVQMIAPAAAPRVPAPKPPLPRLSLDEYLKQREGRA